MKVRNIFDKAEDPGLDCSGDPGATKQSFKRECTISEMVAKARRTGVLPYVQDKPGLYGDFSKVPTYQEALNVVLRAEEQFGGLDAAVRDRFANDPVRFLAFMEDPKNVEEAIRLGLATAREPAGSQGGGVPEGGAGSSGQGSPGGSEGAGGAPVKAGGSA